MRIQIPATWRGKGKLNGKRKPVDHLLYDIVELEIDEISEAEAPLCVESEYVDVRYFNDSFWYPVCAHGRYLKPGEDEPSHKEDIAKYSRLREANKIQVESVLKNSVVATAFGIRDFAIRMSEHFNPDDFKTIDKTDRDTCLAEAEESRQNTILINGALWIRSNTPILKVAPKGRRNPDCDIFPVEEQERNSHGFYGDAMIFDLQMDTELVKSLVFDYSVSMDANMDIVIPEFEILMPEVIENVANFVQFRRDASGAANEWWRCLPEVLNKLNRAELSLFSTMLGYIDALKSQPGDEQARELESHIRLICDSGLVPENVQERLDRALERFEGYTMNEELDVDMPFGATP